MAGRSPVRTSWRACIACVALLAVSTRATALPAGCAGAQGDALAAAPGDLEPRLLRAAFQDLLGRPPLAAERVTWRGRTLGELVAELVGSEAFWAEWLDVQLYYFLLIDNFRPASSGVLELPAELHRGAIGALQALHRVALSPSFDRRNPGPDTFVTVVMEQLLGLTVQQTPRELAIGKRVYDGVEGRFLGRSGSSQADVVRIAFDDARARAHFVQREHRRFLRAEPSRRALARWSDALERDPLAYPSLVAEWIVSEAYRERLRTRAPLPNRLFVRSLFVDVFDRLPDRDEAQRMRNALDGLGDAGPLRSVLARLLIDSSEAALPARESVDDPTAWVSRLFERLLGRAASRGELVEFVAAFHDPACTPQTVMYAIVSHAEYQSW